MEIKKFLLEAITEGEATMKPFRSKKGVMGDTLPSVYKDEIQYSFKTKEGFIYTVVLSRYNYTVQEMYKYHRKTYLQLLKLGLKRESFKDIWSVSFDVSDGKVGKYSAYSSVWSMYTDVNAGEFYRVMATIVKIVKTHMQKYKGTVLNFTPVDDRRANIFSLFIKRQVPGSKVTITNDGEYYFLLNL